MSLFENPDQIRSETLSPEVRQRFYKRLVQEIKTRIERYEDFYLSDNQLQEAFGAPFNKDRFESFLLWIERLSEQERIPGEVKQTQLEDDVLEIKKIYQVIGDLSQQKTVSAEIWKKYEPLREGEYKIFVDYKPLPPVAELRKEFESVDGLIDAHWSLAPMCAEIDETPGERTMIVKSVDAPRTPGQVTRANVVVEEMDELGYRPATEKELYAFAKIRPEIQRGRWTIALGSLMSFDGLKHSSFFGTMNGEDGFHVTWAPGGWTRDVRFLFVRK